MIRIRKAEDRGSAKGISWLKSKHTFSFASYHDPEHMGFESLRVINEDIVIGGGGFATHPHNNMEIVTYVLSGALEHKDSMGNGSVIYPGDVQRMSAGTGLTHSEYNHSKTEDAHFLQIWFLPKERNIKPSYEQKSFADAEKQGQFKLVASNSGRDGSVSLNQDVDIYVALLGKNDNDVIYSANKDRAIWVQIARGEIEMQGHQLKAGDGVAIIDEDTLRFANAKEAEVIVFDMQPISQPNG